MYIFVCDCVCVIVCVCVTVCVYVTVCVPPTPFHCRHQDPSQINVDCVASASDTGPSKQDTSLLNPTTAKYQH